MATSRFATTAGEVKKQKLPAGRFDFFHQRNLLSPRMLGYNQGVPEVKSSYGPAKRGERFWGSQLKCQGDEESLEECGGKENPSCARGEVAGVTCFSGGKFKIQKILTTCFRGATPTITNTSNTGRKGKMRANSIGIGHQAKKKVWGLR